MADNVELNATSGGPAIAADEIGPAKFQRVKLIHGVDGTNDGDVATVNGLPVKEVLNTIAFSGTTTGSLLDGASAVGFGSELALAGAATKVVVRSEFQTTASDSCVVRVWYEDSAGVWSVAGSLYTVGGTAIATGSGPGSAACMEGAGWYFGETWTIDVRGWTTICLELTTAPTTAVSMWGEQV